MGKVMVEVIAMVLEEAIVFVLDFPAGTTGGDNLYEVLILVADY